MWEELENEMKNIQGIQNDVDLEPKPKKLRHGEHFFDISEEDKLELKEQNSVVEELNKYRSE